MTILLSEGGLEWRPISRWAEFLIQFGYRWPVASSGQRRIALVSMPCDSAATGLIALGALIRDLGNSIATNVGGHYDALLRFARQYIKSCRDCDMRCHPELKRCGYSREATGLVRDKNKKRYCISESTDFAHGRLAITIERGTWAVWPKRAIDLRIDGQPPLRLVRATGTLPGHAYAAIVDGATIFPDNLRESYSGLCLAGRAAGATASQIAYASIRFRCGGIEYGLPDPLTIHGWSSSTAVSRMSFFNARTEQLDTDASLPALVIADGGCFLSKSPHPC
jgi:hypothetical protein